MGDLQESIAPMAWALRSGESLAMPDRAQRPMWLESMANGLERLDNLMYAIEAKIVTRTQLGELEAWVQQLKWALYQHLCHQPQSSDVG